MKRSHWKVKASNKPTLLRHEGVGIPWLWHIKIILLFSSPPKFHFFHNRKLYKPLGQTLRNPASVFGILAILHLLCVCYVHSADCLLGIFPDDFLPTQDSRLVLKYKKNRFVGVSLLDNVWAMQYKVVYLTN